MNDKALERVLQGVLRSVLPLMPAQLRRISLLCRALLLAGRVELRFLARCLPNPSQQDSRLRWLRRTLAAPYLRYEFVYRPIVAQQLARLRLKRWHLIIDRTALIPGTVDWVTIGLYYRKRALPLIWQEVPYGGTSAQVYCDLIRQVAPLLPADAQVIFQGDSEFGNLAILRCLQALGWDFIIAHAAKTHVWINGVAQPLGCLPVTPTQPYYCTDVKLFAAAALGTFNLVAFPQPHYDKNGRLKRDTCYLITSLPLTLPIRSLGRRRWAIEPFHKDYKSSGWHLTATRTHPPQRAGLLLVAALCYWLCVCLGRWLCKTGQRASIDAQSKRRLSLFRLGWDFIVHCVNVQATIPFCLRLYL